MSDTPETDGAERVILGGVGGDWKVTPADFSRRLERERDDARRSAQAWEESAAMFHRNAEFYRELIVRIGEPFGITAKTSDDGSIQEDVLALKVPELVDALREENRKLREALENIAEYWNRDQNDSAMADACWHAIHIAESVLAETRQKP